MAAINSACTLFVASKTLSEVEYLLVHNLVDHNIVYFLVHNVVHQCENNVYL